MNRLQRLTVFLCALVFLNEVGPSHLLRHSLLLKTQKERGEAIKDDKRFGVPVGALAHLLKFGYHALELGSQFFADITSLVSIVSEIYAALDDCKRGEYAIIDDWTTEAKDTVNFINSNTHKINEMQLEIKNTQTVAESLNYIFNQTLKEMEEVGLLSEQLLYQVNPSLPENLNKSTIEIEKAVRESADNEEEVDYAEMSGEVIDKIDQSVQVAVPVFTVALPRLPKALHFAKKRLGTIKTSNLFAHFKRLKIKMPPLDSKVFTSIKSWFSRAGTYIKEKIGILRKFITERYSKALKIANGIKDGFFILTGYVGGAFNIYNSIQNFKKCQNLKEQTWKGLQRVREAKKTYDEIMKNVTTAKEYMDTAVQKMIDRVSDDIFLSDLESTKENLIQIQGDGTGLQGMIDSASHYIERVKSTKDIMEVHNMMQNLYENTLGSLPFVYRCLVDKAALVSGIVETCKNGYKSLQQAISSGRTNHNFGQEACAKRIEVKEIPDEQLIEATAKASEIYGFSMECTLNNKDNFELMCDYHCSGHKSGWIAKRLHASPEASDEIKALITKCPPCPVTKLMEITICLEKRRGETVETIQKLVPVLVIGQIQRVFDNCNLK